MKKYILILGLMSVLLVTGCTSQSQDEMIIEIDEGPASSMKASEEAIPVETREVKEGEEIIPEIASETLVYETEFTYEEVLAGERNIIDFLQTLFTVKSEELISPENKSLFSETVASDKIEAYTELYRQAVSDYEEMSVYNIIVEDYDPKEIDVNGKNLSVMEYIVSFSTKDNIHQETERLQRIHLVKEDGALKVFSNNKYEK